MTDTDLITIKVVNDKLREAGTVHARLKPSTRRIRTALEKDQTISIDIPEGVSPSNAQRKVLRESQLRVWAKGRGWSIRIRTSPDGSALIVWREPLPEAVQ